MEIQILFERQNRFFRDPAEKLTAWRPEEIPGLFDRLEHALDRGCHVAGFLSYEAGRAFEPALAGTRETSGFPLAQFGVFHGIAPGPPPPPPTPTRVERRLAIDEAAYRANIGRIRDYIRAGDVYQITYCARYELWITGDPIALFHRLLRHQPVPYPAWFRSEEATLLSLSPELFFRKTGNRIVTRPMKGTWRRGGNPLTDWWGRRRLHYDEKNRAENVMIVDLMRNDLGRVGSQVHVPTLFDVASYTTLHQMTSTVAAEVPPGIRAFDLFRALFPSGSVTGAPKVRAMQIIEEVEPEPRRIHTGAIGYITPSREMFFNVAIRTLLVREGRGEMGVGGGIVWDSTPEGEFAECQLKATFLD